MTGLASPRIYFETAPPPPSTRAPIIGPRTLEFDPLPVGMRLAALGAESEAWEALRASFPQDRNPAGSNDWTQRLRRNLRDKVEASYRRGDLFENGPPLMDDWGAFLGRRPAEVVLLAGKRGRHPDLSV